MKSPLAQFEIKKIIPLELFGIDISFTNASLSMLICLLFIITCGILITRKMKIIPTKSQVIIESIYSLCNNMIIDNIGQEAMRFFPFILAIFSFIFIGNLIGMLPYQFTFTSHIIVNFTLAMIIFAAVIFIGFLKHGIKFLQIFAPSGVPWYIIPIIIPIEIISFIARPVSLSVRLFANMVAGHTMMKVFAAFTVSMGIAGVMPFGLNVLLVGFEIMVCGLQAYVFSILSCIYIKDIYHLH